MASNLTSGDNIYNTTSMMVSVNDEIVEDYGTKISQNTYYNFANKGDTINYSQICRYENIGANTLDLVDPIKVGTLKAHIRLSDKTTLTGTYNEFTVVNGSPTTQAYLDVVKIYANGTKIYEELTPSNVETFSIDISSYGSIGYLPITTIFDYTAMVPGVSPGTVSCMAGVSYINMRTI